MSKEGKRETRTALPDDFGIINNKTLVLRGFKRWKVTGVMPTKQEIQDTDPVWENDLTAAWIAAEFLEDADAVAAETEGAMTL